MTGILKVAARHPACPSVYLAVYGTVRPDVSCRLVEGE
jgi:hypothetical protein